MAARASHALVNLANLEDLGVHLQPSKERSQSAEVTSFVITSFQNLNDK